MMLRREFGLALAFLPLVARAQTGGSPNRGPLFWLISRGKARVFLMGFGDGRADERSWFTPSIQRAFHDSSELWLEVAPPEAPPVRDAAAKAQADAEYQKLSHEPPGRTFFDELEPRARERTLTAMAELGVKHDAVEALRPWSAYYAINRAFWSHAKLSYEPAYVDELLRKLATDQGKIVHYEMPDGVAFARFMAAMPAKAQSQYIEFPLNFLDDQKQGLNATPFDWEFGSPAASVRSLDRMRSELPDLYRLMQVQRNSWWARKIDELLSGDRTSFIGIGQMHVLGPEGIPNQLRRLNIVSPSQISENPPYPA